MIAATAVFLSGCSVFEANRTCGKCGYDFAEKSLAYSEKEDEMLCAKCWSEIYNEKRTCLYCGKGTDENNEVYLQRYTFVVCEECYDEFPECDYCSQPTPPQLLIATENGKAFCTVCLQEMFDEGTASVSGEVYDDLQPGTGNKPYSAWLERQAEKRWNEISRK